MSEQENLENVRRNYKAFIEGDIPTLLNLLADDVDWNFLPPTPAYRGRNIRGGAVMRLCKPLKC
jgi:ketosteroid isomerase-like protein